MRCKIKPYVKQSFILKIIRWEFQKCASATNLVAILKTSVAQAAVENHSKLKVSYLSCLPLMNSDCPTTATLSSPNRPVKLSISIHVETVCMLLSER